MLCPQEDLLLLLTLLNWFNARESLWVIWADLLLCFSVDLLLCFSTIASSQPEEHFLDRWQTTTNLGLAIHQVWKIKSNLPAVQIHYTIHSQKKKFHPSLLFQPMSSISLAWVTKKSCTSSWCFFISLYCEFIRSCKCFSRSSV